jgi:hypothetical protein
MLAGLLGAAVLGSSGMGFCAEVKDNPYQDIVNRNAFALKPPPPPPPPGSEQPPASPVDVLLTGITTLGGVKKVLLQVVEKAPGKQGQPKLPPPLVEGDVEGRVEIVSIDADKGAVMIKIDGNEKTLTFEKDAPKSGGGAGPVPGQPHGGPPGMPNPAGTIPLPNVTTAAGAAAAANAAGASSGFGVMVGGGASSVPAPGAVPGAASVGGVNLGLSSGAAGTPARPVRTDGTSSVMLGGGGVGAVPGGATAAGQAPATTTPSLTREQALATIERQRDLMRQATEGGIVPKGSFPPLPPTSLTPRNPVPPTQ